MKKLFATSMMSFTLLLTACSNDSAEETETIDDATTEVEPSDQASVGDFDPEDFAQQNCASCHGSDFAGAVGPNINGVEESTFTSVVREGKGNMPAFNEDQISDEELDVLASYFAEK